LVYSQWQKGIENGATELGLVAYNKKYIEVEGEVAINMNKAFINGLLDNPVEVVFTSLNEDNSSNKHYNYEDDDEEDDKDAAAEDEEEDEEDEDDEDQSSNIEKKKEDMGSYLTAQNAPSSPRSVIKDKEVMNNLRDKEKPTQDVANDKKDPDGDDKRSYQ
jgi:hypothetical protein